MFDAVYILVDETTALGRHQTVFESQPRPLETPDALV